MPALHLNQLHDPLLDHPNFICSLPPETLSLIFELGQTIEQADLQLNGTSTPHAVPFEISVTHVCSYFREIAIGTQELWKSIDNRVSRSTEELALYLSRARGRALTLRLGYDDISPVPLVVQKFEMVLPHSDRCYQLIIDVVRESAQYPIIRHFVEICAPLLERFSISVQEVESLDMIHTTGDVRVLKGGAPRLSFVRLRGLALPLFRPPLNMVTTLHLDQTLPLPILYSTFCQMVTASPFLVNLSIYGDMLDFPSWPGTTNPIEVPSLRSLRICGITGATYGGLLLGINAPHLDSLVLKNVHDQDLDQFWQSPNKYKFPLLQDLTFHDFEIAYHSYSELFRVFPAITHFTTTYSFDTPMILRILGHDSGRELHGTPWPKLYTLSFLLGLDDDDIIKEVIEKRSTLGCPIQRVRLGSGYHLSVLDNYDWIQSHTILERFEHGEVWPAGGIFDEDDVLF